MHGEKTHAAHGLTRFYTRKPARQSRYVTAHLKGLISADCWNAGFLCELLGLQKRAKRCLTPSRLTQKPDGCHSHPSPQSGWVIKAEIDRPKLERSLKRFAKEFGESNAQAVTRWAVNACRELAFETQAWGTKGTRKKQEGAIIADAYNVLLVVDELVKTQRGAGYRATNQGKSYGVSADNALLSPEDVNEWIELNRTRRRGRTAKLPPTERKACDQRTFKAAMKVRFARAGMAKGGWLGAGQMIARAQTGQERINIGKNFLSYAQKHGGKGHARKPISGWKPFAEISNRTAHSSNKNVLTAGGQKRAMDWSLKKTLNWYRKSVRALDKKKVK